MANPSSYGFVRSRRALDALVFAVSAILAGGSFLFAMAGFEDGALPAKATGFLFLVAGILTLWTLFALAQLIFPHRVRFDWRCLWLDRDQLRKLYEEEAR